MLPDLLHPPDRPNNVSVNAHWLAGEGAGSWFELEETAEGYVVSRYSGVGRLECKGLFKTANHFDISKTYELAFPSHCAKVTIKQNGLSITLRATN